MKLLSLLIFLFAQTLVLAAGQKSTKKICQFNGLHHHPSYQLKFEWMFCFVWKMKQIQTDFQLLLFSQTLSNFLFHLSSTSISDHRKFHFCFCFLYPIFFVLKCLKFYYRIKYERGEKILTFLWGKNKLKFSKKKKEEEGFQFWQRANAHKRWKKVFTSIWFDRATLFDYFAFVKSYHSNVDNI